jgi:hypothetical protein
MQKAILAMSIAGLIAATVDVAGAQSAAVPELFQAHSSKAATAAPANVKNMLRDKTALWASSVSIDRRMLVEARRELTLSMPEGARLRMRLAKSYRTPEGDVVWSGADKLLADGQLQLGAEPPSTALFVVRGQRVTGQIVAATGEVYEVLTSEDGAQQYMVKRNPASLEGADDTPSRVDLAPQPDRGHSVRPAANALLADTIVRILQVYTPEAVTELGGQNSANDRAAFFIAQSNTAFANNALAVRFESAGVQFASQAQSSDVAGTLVARIRSTNDGWFDAYATTERDNTAADIVALVTRDGLNNGAGGGLCGQADAIAATASTAFFVQNQSCSTYTFVHEAAHLFGARHDNDASTVPFSYGHGYVNKSGNFRTIMAVNSNPQPRIGYFSTTDQTYVSGGVTRALGTSTRDNERVMRERAPTMAAFR